jgi:hypothetical protein
MDRLFTLMRQLLDLFQQKYYPDGPPGDMLEQAHTREFFKWLGRQADEPAVRDLKAEFSRELLHFLMTEDESLRAYVLRKFTAARGIAPPHWYEKN